MAESMDIVIGAADTLRGQIVPDGKGGVTAPEEIMVSIHAARAMYYKVRQEHLKRINLVSQLDGMIAGNPPYNPAELKKFGLSHITNFNTMEARSIYERMATCFWNLINEAENLVQFRLVYPETEVNVSDLVRYQDIMSRNWTEVVKEGWDSFIIQMNTLSGQLVKFGVSPLVFHDERDWRWRTVELSKFFVPDQTQCDLNLLTSVCIESMYTVQYLYETYETFKNKKDSPWDCKELSNLLLHIANSYVKATYTDYIDMAELQKRYQNGDVNLDAMFSDSVRIISLFYKEYSGEISHYMFHRVYDSGGFLFREPKLYKNGMTEAVNIFTASPGEFTIHSNRGLGHKIFSIMQAVMQLDCSIVDMSKWASTPMLKTTAVGSQDMQAIRFTPGAPTIIGTAEFQQNNLGANINQLVGASQYLSNKAQVNTANSGDDPGVPDREQGSISTLQAKMRAYKEFNILKHVVAHFYSQLDPVYRVMVSRMMRSKEGDPGYECAYEWKERCIAEGVPKEVFEYNPPKGYLLPRHIRVKATRVAGDGSTLARLMGLQELMPFLGQFGPKQQREYMRQLVTAVLGPDQVQVFVAPENQADENAGGASLAGVENSVMRNGEGPIFSPDNEHRSHFVTHLALGTDTIQKVVQQQLDPVAADKIFTVLMPHLGEHFASLTKSPFTRTFAEQYQKSLDQVSNYAILNRSKAEAILKNRIQQQQEDQMATQQVMSEQQRKDFQATKDEQRKDFKVQSQVERAREANVTRGQVMREKVQRDSENQKLKIQLDSSNKTIENNTIEQNQQTLTDMMGQTPSPIDIE